MTEKKHFLAPAGWVLESNDLQDTECAKLLPRKGGALLIGWPAASQTCSVAWFDTAGKLRVVETLVSKGSYWEGTLTVGEKSYVFTAWKTKNKNGNRRIAGSLEAGATSKLATDLSKKNASDMEGTWGADANNPGGGKG